MPLPIQSFAQPPRLTTLATVIAAIKILLIRQVLPRIANSYDGALAAISVAA